MTMISSIEIWGSERSKLQALDCKHLSPLTSYIKFQKFKYFKAIFRRNKTYSAFRYLLLEDEIGKKRIFCHLEFKTE